MNDYNFDRLNEIIMRHGVQKTRTILTRAFQALGKIEYFGTSGAPEFPPELEEHREWLKRFLVGEALCLVDYAHNAGSLAYRYLRKKNRRQ